MNRFVIWIYKLIQWKIEKAGNFICDFIYNVYLHFLTATTTRSPVMLVPRAILLSPEWVCYVLYQATSVRWDLQSTQIE
jgi:hypothetical protein